MTFASIHAVPNIEETQEKTFDTKEHAKNWHRYMNRKHGKDIHYIATWYSLDDKKYHGSVTFYKKGEPHWIEPTE